MQSNTVQGGANRSPRKPGWVILMSRVTVNRLKTRKSPLPFYPVHDRKRKIPVLARTKGFQLEIESAFILI